VIRPHTFARVCVGAFGLTLLYPLTGFFAPIGPWRFDAPATAPLLASARTSLALTLLAMLAIVAVGTPVAAYVARAPVRERLAWQACFLVSILLPPLALGLLLSLAFGPQTPLGDALARAGVRTSNSATAFVLTQIYVGVGYYVLGAIAAFERVPRSLERRAALLGAPPFAVFRRVTLPLAKLGLAVALSVAWVRTFGEFGAIVVTAYYPAGMPVQLWTDLQSFGLPAAMPLLAAFLAAALPVPWLAHVAAQRRA